MGTIDWGPILDGGEIELSYSYSPIPSNDWWTDHRTNKRVLARVAQSLNRFRRPT